MQKYKKGSDGYYVTSIWDQTFTEGGQKHYINLRSSKSSLDLEKKVRAFEDKMKEIGGTATLDPNISLKELADGWLPVFKAQREKSTIEEYERTIDKLGDIGDIRVKDLLKKDLQILVNDNAKHPRTCKRMMMIYRQLIKYAVSCHLLAPTAVSDLCDDITFPKYKAKERRPLTKEEIEGIHASDELFTPREKAFLYLLFGCGVRREEALALTPFDFNFTTSEVNVRKAIGFYHGAPYEKHTKNHVERVVPMPKSTSCAVRAYLHDMDMSSQSLLFAMKSTTAGSVAGDYMTAGAYKFFWEGIRNKIDVGMKNGKSHGLTAHIFRHNYCTQLCYQAASGKLTIKKVAELMGDTVEMVMHVYSHIMDEKEDVAGAVEGLEQTM